MTVTVTRIPFTDASALDPYRGAVHAVVRAARDTDGISPVNERGRFALHGDLTGVHWLATTDEGPADHTADTSIEATPVTVVGWAWLDPADGSVQLVVDPAHRRRGIGRALAEAVLADAHPEHWWAFGTLPGAVALAARLELTLQRQLFIMVRDIAAHPPGPIEPPAGIELISFTPDLIGDLVRVNAAAFAHHPEQGAMSIDDVALKAAEPWFDPAGLLFARDQHTGEVLGFHWTKVTPPATAAAEGSHTSAPAGEVYVLGVHPDAGSRGLGRFLLNAGLAHLVSRGVDHVHLYVEADQERVVNLYDSANFVVRTRDSSFG